MEISTEIASDYLRLMTVQVSADEVLHALNTGIHDFFARTGARPLGEDEDLGQAIIDRFGEDRADMARSNIVINYLLPLALDEVGLTPACSPIPVDPAAPELGKMYMFLTKVYITPAMELSSYDAPKAVVKRVRISGRDVDNQLMALAKEFATIEFDPTTGEQIETLPVINDEWVRDVFPDDDVNTAHELRSMVRQALEVASQDDLEQEKVAAAIKTLGRRLVGEVPQEIVDIIAADMFAGINEEALGSGRFLELELRQNGMTLDQYKAELAEQARANVIEGIVMDAIYRHFEMDITEADVEATIQGIASTAEAMYREEALANLRAMADSAAIQEVARRMKASQWIADNAIITVA